MIPLQDQEFLKQRFTQDLPNRVRIDFFSQRPSPIYIPGRQECAFCSETQTLMQEIAALSNRIALTEHDIDADAKLASSSLQILAD